MLSIYSLLIQVWRKELIGWNMCTLWAVTRQRQHLATKRKFWRLCMSKLAPCIKTIICSKYKKFNNKCIGISNMGIKIEVWFCFYVLVGNKCKHITVNKAERVVIISPPLENCLNFQLCCKLLKERNDHWFTKTLISNHFNSKESKSANH